MCEASIRQSTDMTVSHLGVQWIYMRKSTEEMSVSVHFSVCVNIYRTVFGVCETKKLENHPENITRLCIYH